MSDFLLELYSEEIPGMAARAAADLQRLLTAALAEHGIAEPEMRALHTPQRLALLGDLPAATEAAHIEKVGPRVDAPEKAIQGFLRSNGLDDVAGLTTREDPKKGAYYVLEHTEAARPMGEVLAACLPDIIAAFPWPKSMRWGAGSLRWVRPLRNILCRFDGAVVPFEIGGVESVGFTYGHRFLSPEKVEIKRAKDYVAALKKRKVLADADARRVGIKEQAEKLAAEVGCVLVEDAPLVDEIAGLVEWPLALRGEIDPQFMDVPEEILVSAMRTHQKYLALHDTKGGLAPHFIAVSNGGNAADVAAGNARVLSARLADAKFFWEQDCKTPLEDFAAGLDKLVFHAKLGTMAEKVARMQEIIPTYASEFVSGTEAVAQSGKPDSPYLPDVMEIAGEAVKFAKADLVSSTVREFPALQGIIGGYLAEKEGLDDKIAAIRDHYKPVGRDDDIPETPEGCVVALADKIDTLAGFWLIGEKPTGSKDPYALRRAALGIIRILLEEKMRFFNLPSKILEATYQYKSGMNRGELNILSDDIFDFIKDRLKDYLRKKHELEPDVIAAAFAAEDGTRNDIYDLMRQAKNVTKFLATPEGDNLRETYRRAYNICKKADRLPESSSLPGHGQYGRESELYPTNEKLLCDPAERKLHEALKVCRDKIYRHPKEAYSGYREFRGEYRELEALAELCAPVDDFFKDVRVDDDDPAIRDNRYTLLQRLIVAMRTFAAFELIEKNKKRS